MRKHSWRIIRNIIKSSEDDRPGDRHHQVDAVVVPEE
jgi:hypothetical protein